MMFCERRALSAKMQDSNKYLEEAVNEMETIKAEAAPEFDPEWKILELRMQCIKDGEGGAGVKKSN
jgi:hypothetical protein